LQVQFSPISSTMKSSGECFSFAGIFCMGGLCGLGF
jgi:hypothetical protein